jgi:hypothetical protein
MPLEPGEAAFINNVGDAMTVTFVGEVRQGDLSTSLPAGFALASSQVPQEGMLATDLEFPAGDGDTIYLFRNGTYEIYNFFFGAWSPSDPTINVAEGFFVNKAAAADWTRTFSVN